MELLEFLLLCFCTQSFGSDIPSSSSQPLHPEDLLSDTPLSSIFLVLCAVLYTSSCLPNMGRECWKVPRNSTAWEGVQNHTFVDAHARDKEWRKNYRMGFASLTYLTEEIRPYIENPNTDFVREPVDVKKAVAMVIHRLAHGDSPRKIGDLYNLGASTVIKYTKIITDVLASRNKLYSKYIVIPTEERIQRLSSDFESITGIPNICGAIGGTHIKLQLKPRNSYRPADYLSTHGFYSVLLQGVCDADKVFWDVCCNAPGGLDNATHFRASSIWNRLGVGEILRQPEIRLRGGAISRPFLVGDGSFPLSSSLITPFYEANPEAIRENQFDEDLLRGQEKIGNAFAVLKKRWKILEKLNVDVKYAAQTILACCVLHNFCQIADEPEPEEQVDSSPNQELVISYEDEDERNLQMIGKESRRVIFLEWLHRREEAELERAARRPRLL
ncbi:hypothetical protein SUGI_0238360 [Cryptomeria japonica]|nr:hypothetical protein SUGI_0238360 [Cryptomeria japonica]